MEHRSIESFTKELRNKVAIDPISLAGGITAAKIMATNALNRHGMKLAPIRRLGQEIAGVGVRTAQQGKPMLSRPLREAMAIGLDPKLTGLYETAHHVGTKVHPGQIPQLKQGLGELTRHMPDATQHAEFLKGIPLESKGWRKAVDYTFKPVGEVASDVKGLLTRKRPVAPRPSMVPSAP